MTPAGAGLIALLAAASPPASAPEAARQILQRGRFQTDLPSATASPAPTTEASAGATGSRGLRRTSADRERGTIPAPPAGVVWAFFAVLLVLGLGWAVRQAVGSRRGRDVPPVPEPPAAPPTATRPRLRIGPLTDVEELARQGRFGEAIHLLLLHLFAALQRRPATAPAPAHTGREVLARTTLTSEARGALGVLVGAAEAVHFGGRDAAREDYENCLGHYRRFLDAFERTS